LYREFGGGGIWVCLYIRGSRIRLLQLIFVVENNTKTTTTTTTIIIIIIIISIYLYTMKTKELEFKRGCPLTSSEWWHMMKNKIPS